jgi:hypothetical protein
MNFICLALIFRNHVLEKVKGGLEAHQVAHESEVGDPVEEEEDPCLNRTLVLMKK